MLEIFTNLIKYLFKKKLGGEMNLLLSKIEEKKKKKENNNYENCFLFLK